MRRASGCVGVLVTIGRLQFSVGFELRHDDGEENGSVLIMGVWDLVP